MVNSMDTRPRVAQSTHYNNNIAPVKAGAAAHSTCNIQHWHPTESNIFKALLLMFFLHPHLHIRRPMYLLANALWPACDLDRCLSRSQPAPLTFTQLPTIPGTGEVRSQSGLHLSFTASLNCQFMSCTFEFVRQEMETKMARDGVHILTV